MTGEKKTKFGLSANLSGFYMNRPNTKTQWQIVCILRRAVGLPYSDYPATEWREDGTHKRNLDVFDMIPVAWREDPPANPGRLPLILACVCGISDAVGGPEWGNPKLVAKELNQLRNSLRDLRRRILLIDNHTMELIDLAGDSFVSWFAEVGEVNREEFDREEVEHKDWHNSKYHQWPVEGVLEYMDQFDVGLTKTLEDVEREIRDRKDMGQSRTYVARRVALDVAKYMYRVNGKIPGFWIEDIPSTPYAKAVLEIYDLLGIPSGSFQKAGAWAISKLKSDQSSEVLQK